MTALTDRLDEMFSRADRAGALVAGLSSGRTEWHMHIPADVDRDSDLILDATVNDAAHAVKALRAVLAWFYDRGNHDEECGWTTFGDIREDCDCPLRDLYRAIAAALDVTP